MSLINEALKKTQARQIQANQPPGAFDAAHQPMTAAADPSRKMVVQLAIGLSVLGVLLIGAVTLTIFLIARQSNQNSELKRMLQDAEAARMAAAQAQVAPAAEEAVEEPVATDVAPPEGETEPALAEGDAAAPVEAEAIPVAEPPAEPVVAEAAPVDADAVRDLVNSLIVRGTTARRALIFVPGATDARAFSAGDIVTDVPLLRLETIYSDTLTFTDVNGKTYVKRF